MAKQPAKLVYRVKWRQDGKELATHWLNSVRDATQIAQDKVRTGAMSVSISVDLA